MYKILVNEFYFNINMFKHTSETLSLLSEVKFDQAFMYAYSLRDKTHAAHTMNGISYPYTYIHTTYIHTYMHIYTHTYIFTYIHAYINK